MTIGDRLRIGFGLAVLCVFAYAAFEARDFSRLARYMPLYVSVAGVILCALLVVLDVWRLRAGTGRAAAQHQRALEDFSPQGEPSPGEAAQRLKATAYYLGWLTGYILLIAVVGLPVASALFLAAFLRLEARMGIVATAIGIAGMLAGLMAMTQLMHLRWPSSLMGW